ncbi:Limonene 1,2-monooxygenase [Deinococcus saxicola]|uniref:Atu2307/SP_0267 family LLM class monooxygenase n=1 Tax=Deinococcus saxicola TaxID=249406 RepID=UPI0039F05D5F
MQIGIDSFAAAGLDLGSSQALSDAQRLAQLLEEVEQADRSGIDVFGVGEHHRSDYLDSAPSLILAAAAARTTRIRLTSAVTVLSADDPVRVFQQFATLDLLSQGRAEMVVGRGSSVEAYPLFGYDLADYDSLFAEKLGLLLLLREQTEVHWSGRYRPPLSGQGVYPRPLQAKLPIWLGVGGTPASFARAGSLGLPLMVAIIGGDFRRFRPLVDLYRQAGQQAGYAADQLQVGVHALGFVGESDEQARNAYYPGFERMMTTVGRERGWGPPNRAQFEAACGPTGPYMIGDPQTVAQKVRYIDGVLGGVSRLTFQMTNALMPHAEMLRAIELLGTRVAPLVRIPTPDRLASIAPVLG